MFEVVTQEYALSWSVQTQDPYDRPWASASSKSHGRKTSAERIVKPAKGTAAPIEFTC